MSLKGVVTCQVISPWTAQKADPDRDRSDRRLDD